MFSRCFLLIASLVLVMGCSKGPASSDQPVVRLKVGGTQCLSGMGARFANYFTGGAAADELSGAWSCIHQVLSDFERLTSGAKSDRYSTKEVREFLTRYFFKEGLPENVVVSTMSLKTLLVGGTADEITRSEIVELLRKVRLLDTETKTLWPHTKILFTSQNNKANDMAWDQAYVAFRQVSKRLSQQLPTGAPYTFASAEQLLISWADFLNIAPDHFLRKFGPYLPIANQIKKLLVGGDARVVQGDDWVRLFDMLTEAFMDLRLANRLIEQNPADMSMALASPRLEALLRGVVGIFDRGVEAQANKQIAFSEIDVLVQSLDSAGLLSGKYSAASVNKAVRFLFGKVFDGPQAYADGLDRVRIAEMKRLIYRWNANQVTIMTGDFQKNPELGTALRPGWNFTFDSQGRLQFQATSAKIPAEFSLVFTLVQWIGEKWSTWPVELRVFQQLVAEFLEVFHALDILTSVQPSIFNRLNREANLFLPSSNGDGHLDTAEAFQYAVFALSGYRGSHAMKRENPSCDSDACFSTTLFQGRQKLLSQFPNLLTRQAANAKSWQAFDRKVATISGENSWIVHFVVYHYIETFLQRFDVNGDQLIDLAECTNSYPIYGGILAEMLGDLGFDTSETWPLYTFMFNYGATPLSVFGGTARYFVWKTFPHSWAFLSDRDILAGILSELSKL